jgi:hypothetical protein
MYEKGMHYLCAVPWVFFVTLGLSRTGVLPSLVGGEGWGWEAVNLYRDGNLAGRSLQPSLAGAAQQRIF